MEDVETAAFYFLLWAELLELLPVSSGVLGDPTVRMLNVLLMTFSTAAKRGGRPRSSESFHLVKVFVL